MSDLKLVHSLVKVPVLAHPAMLNSLGANYGYLVQDNLAMAVVFRKKLGVFKQAICGSIPFYIDSSSYALANEESNNFINIACIYLKNLDIDNIICPPTYNIFQTIPENSNYCRFGTYKIDLSLDEDILFANLHSKHRNVIRKAEKDGVEIVSGDKYLEDVHSLCAQTMNREHLSFAQITDYQKFSEQLGSNKACFLALHNNIPQACALIVFDAYSGYYLHGGSSSHPQSGAANLLQWHIIKFLKQQGTAWYDFVGARLNPASGSRLEGIQRFKERFGANMHQGYLWKMDFKPAKVQVFSYLRKLKQLTGSEPYRGDIIDQEQ